MSSTAVNISHRLSSMTVPTGRMGAPITLHDWSRLGKAFLSSDLKVGTVASSPTRASDSVKCATWLPSGPPSAGLGGGCCGASDYCYRDQETGRLVCYAARLEQGRSPSLARLVAWRASVWNALGMGDRMTLCCSIIREAYAAQVYPSTTSTHAAQPVTRPVLRIGAGGDLQTLADGQAWDAALHWAAEQYPSLRTWLYSRSYQVPGQPGAADPLGPLADGIAADRYGGAFQAYLSTDPSMVDRTRRALRRRYSHLPVAVLADDRAQALAILDDLGRSPLPSMVCPVDRQVRPWATASRLPAEPYAQGACPRCRACIEPAGRRTTCPDIIFPRR